MQTRGRRIAAVMAAATVTVVGFGFAAAGWGQTGCLKLVSEDLVEESGTPTYKAEIKNGCGYVAKDVRVRLVFRDPLGQVFLTRDYPLNPGVLGYDEVGQYTIPLTDLPQKPHRVRTLLLHKR